MQNKILNPNNSYNCEIYAVIIIFRDFVKEYNINKLIYIFKFISKNLKLNITSKKVNKV